ncbi:MAG: hypothetical protein ACE5QW_08875 [Thermoplasmata archaeon]
MKAEAFLAAVERKLFGMDGTVRRDIIDELRTHIRDESSDSAEDVESVIESMGSPSELARKYKEIYGYGFAFKFLFAFSGLLLAISTLPILPFIGGELILPLWGSVGFLIALVLYLIWVSVVAGRRVGGAVGLVACITRLAGILLIPLLAKGVPPYADVLDLAAFVLVSVSLIAVGYIPGKSKEKWEARVLEG